MPSIGHFHDSSAPPLDPAKTLSRRFRDRAAYRRRRDRKIAVDWLGRTFEQRYQNGFGQIEWLPVRLESYEPNNHTLVMRCLWKQAEGSTITLSTDDFWSRLRTGTMRQA